MRKGLMLKVDALRYTHVSYNINLESSSHYNFTCPFQRELQCTCISMSQFPSLYYYTRLLTFTVKTLLFTLHKILCEFCHIKHTRDCVRVTWNLCAHHTPCVLSTHTCVLGTQDVCRAHSYFCVCYVYVAYHAPWQFLQCCYRDIRSYIHTYILQVVRGRDHIIVLSLLPLFRAFVWEPQWISLCGKSLWGRETPRLSRYWNFHLDSMLLCSSVQ